MSEQGQNLSSVEHIRQIVKDKSWYGLGPKGEFNWDLSVQNIADTIHKDPKLVHEAIASAFTEACLSCVQEDDGNGSFQLEPLVSVLKKKGIPYYVWTVGDKDWQKIKFERSTASEYVDDEHFISCGSNKVERLRQLLLTIPVDEVKNTLTHVIAVDDKDHILYEVMQLSDSVLPHVILHNYHMKLSDPRANPTAFISHLHRMMNEHQNEKFIIFLDFDGVVADTDSVLFNQASENLAVLRGAIILNPALFFALRQDRFR